MSESSLVLVIGGFCDKTRILCKNVEVLLSPSCQFPSIPVDFQNGSPRGGSGLVTPDGKYLLCGGYEDSQAKTCLEFDRCNKSWVYHSTMTKQRDFSRAVALSAGSYILGAWVGHEEDSSEFLPAGSSEWEVGPVPPRNISYTCAVALDRNSFLILGGFWMKQEVWKYDQPSDAWTRLPDLPNEYKVYKHDCIMLGDLVLVVGGSTYKVGEGTVYYRTFTYNPTNGAVRQMGDLIVGRSEHKIVELAGDIFVVGGHRVMSNADREESVEKLNKLTEKWEAEDTSLKVGRTQHTLLKISGSLAELCG